MIWLVSFPRSGNTFLRNVLFEVYGIASSTFHLEDYPLDKDYETYPVIKTHVLPHQARPNAVSRPIVYIVRDGRDALVSLAHHKKVTTDPNSNFQENLLEAILSEGDSFFGGWSEHVEQWAGKATLIIRFEDLIKDPIEQVERLRNVMELPQPDLDKVPSFEQLKFGTPQYGSGARHGKQKDYAQEHFRRGKIGAWKDEMDEGLQLLFWSYHRDAMERMGYGRDGSLKDGKKTTPHFTHATRKKVLIEATKLLTGRQDGIKRYVSELLRGLVWVADSKDWQLDVYIFGEIYSIEQCLTLLDEQDDSSSIYDMFAYEKFLLGMKDEVKKILSESTYEALAGSYRKMAVRKVLWQVKKVFKRRELNRLFNEKNTLRGGVEALNDDRRKQKIEDYDLIHLTLPQHIEPFESTKVPMVGTVHDLTHIHFPEFHQKENVLLAEKGTKHLVQKSCRIIAVSDATKQDIQNQYEVDHSRIDRIYEAVSCRSFRPNRSEHIKGKVLDFNRVGNTPYLLCLSTIEPRKNLINTIKAFHLLMKQHPELDVNLVIAGKKGWQTEGVYDEELQSDRIIFTGFVADNDLPVLYTEALAFCYVSYYEGFGLPALEAMSCGTPVIYGNNSSLIEVVGDSGCPADPNNIKEIKEQMLLMVSNPKEREKKGKEALMKSFEFSWNKAAKETLQVYEKAIGEGLS